MTKQVTKQLEKPPRFVRMSRLLWGEAKVSFSSLITPSGHKMLKEKAADLQLSKSDLIEYLSRSLDDPEVEGAIRRQITSMRPK
ncbi:hypothetical protein H6G96_32650 [Nostoc sp. FACHB-892]|uniref:hypothetical protein n=1 Tax=Nostoc sp. FACHB-892 TaxID=2692843 RepID=UPI001684AF18|nr:hypothetical protein [Nostoc sp. FACHB-892]MBD2730942.1 hypothetical protein [Nostoc sp. FACHB-892]